MTDAEKVNDITQRLIKWCDLHSVVVGGNIFNGMKLLILAEIKRANEEKDTLYESKIKELEAKIARMERVINVLIFRDCL